MARQRPIPESDYKQAVTMWHLDIECGMRRYLLLKETTSAYVLAGRNVGCYAYRRRKSDLQLSPTRAGAVALARIRLAELDGARAALAEAIDREVGDSALDL